MPLFRKLFPTQSLKAPRFFADAVRRQNVPVVGDTVKRNTSAHRPQRSARHRFIRTAAARIAAEVYAAISVAH